MTALEKAIEAYCKITATQNLILGIKKGGDLYACYTTYENLAFQKSLKKDSESPKKGGRNKWRFRPNNKQREAILKSSLKIEKVGTLQSLESTKWNKGEMFESLITGRTKKDSTPHTQAGDYTDENGTEWQIKFENATCFYEVK